MQKDFMSDTWEDVKRCAVGRKIFLFGAGSCGEAVWKQMEYFSSSWEVVGFLDNNIEKQGKKLRGLTVFSPNVLKEYDLGKKKPEKGGLKKFESVILQYAPIALSLGQFLTQLLIR